MATMVDGMVGGLAWLDKKLPESIRSRGFPIAYNIFEFNGPVSEEIGNLPEGIDWTLATMDNVADFFGHNEVLVKISRRFVEDGYHGVLLHQAGKLVGYLWHTDKNTKGPWGLPVSVTKRDPYWVFHGGIEPDFQRRGLFNHMTAATVRHVLSMDPKATVFGDIPVFRIAPQKAFLKVGFKPAGVMISFRIPKTEKVYGRWFKEIQHPGGLK